MNWKRVVAREWLVFLGCVLSSSALLFLVAALVGDLSQGFEFEDLQILLTLGVLFWAFVMLIRSVVWAVRELRGSE